MTQGRVRVLVGVPGSGKSTWAQAQGCQVLSSDEIRKLLCGDETNQNIHNQVFGAMRYLLRARLEIGQMETIVDATNLRWRDRRPWLQLAKKYGARVDAVYFDVPLDLALERNAKRPRIVPSEVVRKLYLETQPPTIAEGFTSVQTISA